MTPSRIPVEPKPTFNMTPSRTPASLENQLVQEPVRLTTPTQPSINTSPDRVLRSNSRPLPVGHIVKNVSFVRMPPPIPAVRDARMSLNKDFEAVNSPDKKTSNSKPEHNDNDGHAVSTSKELLEKTNFKSSDSLNKPESLFTVSVADSSFDVSVNTSQKDKQINSSAFEFSERSPQLCTDKNSDSTSTGHSQDNCQQAVNKLNLKRRFLTPYPKGSLPQSTDQAEVQEAVDSPEITNRSTNSFDLSGINILPATPITLSIKVKLCL